MMIAAVLALDPVVGAIAAGCTVCLKTSEIAPATSALLARLLPEYVDTEAIKVVEGSIPEVTALLEQKWDKIFYTGEFLVTIFYGSRTESYIKVPFSTNIIST